jgi:hypothetical protein
MNDWLSVIREQGDFLERHIFQDDEFVEAFKLYPAVWAKCVLPNRINNSVSFANDEWSEFASRHYTALIRCWNARLAKFEINNLCEATINSHDPSIHIKLHGDLFSFFCHCGSAIDNLEWAFASKTINSPNTFANFKIIEKNGRSLKWFYNRRTQWVHHSIVPVNVENGLPKFDISLLTQDETVWDPCKSTNYKSISEEIDILWADFKYLMSCAWSKLLDRVNSDLASKSNQPNPIYPLYPTTSPVFNQLSSETSVSGVPSPSRPSGLVDKKENKKKPR